MTMSEHSQLIEIHTGHDVYAVTFTANGKYLVCGGREIVQLWRVKDGKQVAAMRANGNIARVAVSKDGRWIAAGSWGGDVLVWDTATYGQVIAHKAEDLIPDVDFSSNSSCVVSADGNGYTATIWDIEARQKVRTLDHGSWVGAAKYSSQSDRIATATDTSVHIWDSNDGRLLVTVNASVWNGPLWFENHLFLTTDDSKIKQINASTGLTVSEWIVPRHTDNASCIALPQHGKFIAYSTNKTVTFWDTSTHTQLGLIQMSHPIDSVAFSADGQLLAISGKHGEIIIKDPSFITEPEILIEGPALYAWKHGQLTNAEALLTAAVPTSHDTTHHVLASRALVRARLRKWDAALADAQESIEIQPSAIGYIAQCVALVGKGDRDKGCRACDIAFQYFRLEHVSLFLLIKAVVLFMAGAHVDAISRLGDLIPAGHFDSTFYVVLAYMRVLLGNLHMKNGDYERAIQSFEDARVELGSRTRPPPLIISLISGWKFDDLPFIIHQGLCESLFASDRTKESGESVLRVVDQEINMSDLAKLWFFDFKSRCCSKLEVLGNNAMNAKQYDEVISLYTIVLLLKPPNPQDLLVTRSKACAEKGDWGAALRDANEVISLDPSSPLGYERKHEALRGAGHYAEAINAFETMLMKIMQSPDHKTRERSHHYVQPEQTKKAIRTRIRNTTHNSPSVLIDTISGRICNKSEQASAFESTPVFAELISSMTTQINHTQIGEVVEEFYRYTTFSHIWEDNEPLFETVTGIVVYDLEASPTHDKLRMFCNIVRELGFNWAWSNTCCIDKGNHFMLQEALANMFKWYEGSAMTIVFLRDVHRQAERGALIASIWNTCVWALQEYRASKVVRFYTAEWTPYLDLDIYNHKESSEITSEIEEATGVSAEFLAALRPGLDDIREKLCLASTRQTTRAEDAAYSLLGMFSLSLPISYGEGDKVLGRLLAKLLMQSGDMSILAWTGRSGSFNSCLPANITVFSQPATSHIPPHIPEAEMRPMTVGVRSYNQALVTRLYDQLNELPVPSFSGRRVRFPCLSIKLGQVTVLKHGSERVFRARAPALGTVDIRADEDLSQLRSLYLVHPWIDFLLDRQPVGNVVDGDDMDDVSYSSSALGALSSVPFDVAPRKTGKGWFASHIPRPFGGRPDVRSLWATSIGTALPAEKQTRLLEFIARLRQPFGALLLTSAGYDVEEYRRVAAESLITVQLGEITSPVLEGLIRGVQMLDVL